MIRVNFSYGWNSYYYLWKISFTVEQNFANINQKIIEIILAKKFPFYRQWYNEYVVP
jgi:hypothetical protein